MEADLLDGKLGSVGKYDIEFKEGKLKALVDAELPIGKAQLVVELGADAVLDALAKAIPGQVDDAVFGLLKTALKV